MSKESKPKILHAVPADAPSRPCRRCDKTIYWITTAAGRHMPIDCDVEGGAVPVSGENGAPGRGVPHFATCPTWYNKPPTSESRSKSHGNSSKG